MTQALHSTVRNNKRRCFLSSLGLPTTECAADSDSLHRPKLTHAEEHRSTKQTLDRIPAMLVELAKRRERG